MKQPLGDTPIPGTPPTKISWLTYPSCLRNFWLKAKSRSETPPVRSTSIATRDKGSMCHGKMRLLQTMEKHRDFSNTWSGMERNQFLIHIDHWSYFNIFQHSKTWARGFNFRNLQTSHIWSFASIGPLGFVVRMLPYGKLTKFRFPYLNLHPTKDDNLQWNMATFLNINHTSLVHLLHHRNSHVSDTFSPEFRTRGSDPMKSHHHSKR